MIRRVRSTRTPLFSRLVSVLACLCAFTVLPLPLLSGMSWAESSEAECPLEEENENCEEESVVTTSLRRRVYCGRAHCGTPVQAAVPARHSNAFARRWFAIVGHQLANGLCAPLVV